MLWGNWVLLYYLRVYKTLVDEFAGQCVLDDGGTKPWEDEIGHLFYI